MAKPKKTFNVPSRLIALQKDLYAAEADLEAIPMAPIDPATLGRTWTPEQREQMGVLRDRLRDLAARIAADEWWEGIAREDLVDARSAVKVEARTKTPVAG
ncbi:hypothetical protein [Actinacidiphila oryziradicis]|uniref:Uncharacterized protein n=1 Tax=Actinacidiphila oryziradicis TaxID=2571141 RepID=A0A4U0RMM5_9ACTN|nr:hypothetical protein [Actinacidiphila oryziradicis]TJZ97133.1 hypothetical protein FCI23_49910 [Actinacidiphila oryziradicis]